MRVKDGAIGRMKCMGEEKGIPPSQTGVQDGDLNTEFKESEEELEKKDEGITLTHPEVFGVLEAPHVKNFRQSLPVFGALLAPTNIKPSS